jgi:hypothetical protein
LILLLCADVAQRFEHTERQATEENEHAQFHGFDSRVLTRATALAHPGGFRPPLGVQQKPLI